MTTLKIWKTGDPVKFAYNVDSELTVLQVYDGSTLLLSALNKYLSYNNSDDTKWVYVRDAVNNQAATSYLGRDGVLYKFPQPTFLYERQEDGVDPIMGSPVYRYVRFALDLEENISADETYVISPVAGYITMALWKTQNLYTEEQTASDGNITALKELTTGFTVPLNKLNSVIGLNGEPLNSATPRDIVVLFKLIETYFYSRLDRMSAINSNGEFEF